MEEHRQGMTPSVNPSPRSLRDGSIVHSRRSLYDTNNAQWRLFNQNKTRAVFIRDLPFHCQSEDLKGFIVATLPGLADGIEEVTVRYGQHGKTLQVACVLFREESMATYAIEHLHGKRLDGRDLRVGPYNPAAKMETSKVAEIRFTFSSVDEKMTRITEGSVRQAFEKDVGLVHDVGIRLHRTSPEGLQSGYGFMTFVSPVHNKLVAEEYSGRVIDGIQFECTWSSCHNSGEVSESTSNGNTPKHLQASLSSSSDTLPDHSTKPSPKTIVPVAAPRVDLPTISVPSASMQQHIPPTLVPPPISVPTTVGMRHLPSTSEHPHKVHSKLSPPSAYNPQPLNGFSNRSPSYSQQKIQSVAGYDGRKQAVSPTETGFQPHYRSSPPTQVMFHAPNVSHQPMYSASPVYYQYPSYVMLPSPAATSQMPQVHPSAAATGIQYNRAMSSAHSPTFYESHRAIPQTALGPATASQAMTMPPPAPHMTVPSASHPFPVAQHNLHVLSSPMVVDPRTVLYSNGQYLSPHGSPMYVYYPHGTVPQGVMTQGHPQHFPQSEEPLKPPRF